MSTVEKIDKNKVSFEFSVSAEEFEKAVEKAYRKNVGKINIQGFRKGKAPRQIIEKFYGAEIFYDDAINIVLPDAYDKAIEENNIHPVAQPEIDLKGEITKESGVTFTAQVVVKPEFEMGTYKGISATKVTHRTLKKDVDAEIEKLRERNSRMVPVEDRAVKKDDVANIDFEGFCDGVPFAGGKGEGFDLTIGSGQFIPGFEEQIVGKNIGDEFDVNVSFPEEYHAEDLKGKPAVFKVKVNSIQYKEMPELDDEFAKDISEFDTLDELKADIRAKLEEQAAKTTQQERENAVIDKLVEETEIDVPECMIDTRIENIIRENNMRMAQQGISFEQYLSYMGSSVDQFKEMMRPNAEKQVKANLILEAIVKKEAFEITDEMVDDKIKEMAEMYHMEADKLKENITDNDKENIKADMQMEKAVALIVDNVKWSKAKAAKSTTKTAAKTAKAADEEAKAEKPAAKKTTTKSTAAKSTAAKSTAKTTTAKSTAKSTTAKSTTKSTTAKSTAAKKPAAKKAEPAAKKSEKKEKAEVEA